MYSMTEIGVNTGIGDRAEYSLRSDRPCRSCLCDGRRMRHVLDLDGAGRQIDIDRVERHQLLMAFADDNLTRRADYPPCRHAARLLADAEDVAALANRSRPLDGRPLWNQRGGGGASEGFARLCAEQPGLESCFTVVLE